MVTSESNPLIKTGGLADVVYALSKELAKKNDVCIVMPFYIQIQQKLTKRPLKVKEIEVNMSWRKQKCIVYKTVIEGIKYFLIKNDQYFYREQVYGYLDDMERFACFTLAAKLFLEKYKQLDIVHIHDWHPGMLPVLVRDDQNSSLNKAKFVLTIHNPAFKGYMDKYFLGNFYNLSDKYYDDGSVRFNNQVSTLKASIVFVNKITTVSPTHRHELIYDDISDGLNGVLKYRQNDFIGILNGIDEKEFNPQNDTKIYFPYKDEFNTLKKKNKMALLKELNLELDDRPLFGMVSRLTWQKGLDILIPNIRELLVQGDKVIILGSGEEKYENELRGLQYEFPKQLAIYIGYNDELAHKIYAASDIFLMPSLFEPCGLSQMIALKYATLPLVRLIGGLKDSVIPYMNENLDEANGFGFYDYSFNALKETIDWSKKVYYDKKKLQIMRVNAIKAKNDWKKSSEEYLKLYKSII